MIEGRKTPYNSTLAIDGVSFSADSFAVADSSVHRINICAEKPAHRQSAKRCAKCPKAFSATSGHFAQLRALRNWTTAQSARLLCAIIPLNVNYKKKIKIYLLIVNF
jgi:hypothetical protein